MHISTVCMQLGLPIEGDRSLPRRAVVVIQFREEILEVSLRRVRRGLRGEQTRRTRLTAGNKN